MRWETIERSAIKEAESVGSWPKSEGLSETRTLGSERTLYFAHSARKKNPQALFHGLSKARNLAACDKMPPRSGVEVGET